MGWANWAVEREWAGLRRGKEAEASWSGPCGVLGWNRMRPKNKVVGSCSFERVLYLFEVVFNIQNLNIFEVWALFRP